MTVTTTNLETWDHPRFVRDYLGTELRPAEARIVTEQEAFAGRVLEIGCGAGRVTGHLRERATTLTAIDVAEPMLERARERYPEVRFERLSMTELDAFGPAAFDAVIASCNVIDVLDDATRREFLRDARRILDAEGVLVFSSHNRGHLSQLKEPWQLPTNRLLSFAKALVRLPMRLRNRHRLHPLEVHAADYDIRNDSAHDWRLLQYYVSPSDQRRQLAECGFELLACVGVDDLPIADDDPCPERTELYYVAVPT